MFKLKLVDKTINLSELKEIAKQEYGSFTKAVVDLSKQVMVLSLDMHVDGETYLLENDSVQENLWGINIHPEAEAESRVEFDSMINIRPRQNNRSRYIESEQIRTDIKNLVKKLINDK